MENREVINDVLVHLFNEIMELGREYLSVHRKQFSLMLPLRTEYRLHTRITG